MASIGEIYPENAEKSANDQIQSLKERSRDFAQKAREKTQAISDDAIELVRNHPKQTIGIALAAGAVLGAIVAISLRREETATERISNVGNDVWNQLKSGLEEATGALKESLEKALKTIK